MLEARPSGIFLNCGYRLLQGTHTVATVRFSWWGNGGTLICDRQRYQIRLSGFPLRNKVHFMERKTCVAIAKRPLIPPQILLEYAGQQYQFNPLNLTISQTNQVIGSVIYPRSWFNRRIQFDLPDSMPFLAQIFLAWLVLERNISD
jgi:hypothetical protein